MIRLLVALACSGLVACSMVVSPAQRQAQADQLAQARAWQAVRLDTEQMVLVAYLPRRIQAGVPLAIYIEGDGLAWMSPSQPSADPTPREPIGLQLALAHPSGNAAYLARPCQYVDAEQSACPQAYWTEQRFAPAVVAATNQAVDQLKQRFAARDLTLVGYSGGGTMAALVAARRSDVVRLVTVAGNLDPSAWTAYHRLQPLTGSLSPVDDVSRLQDLPQLHLVGGQDTNVPPWLAEGFARRFSRPLSPGVQVIEPFDHQCCWVAQWPALWMRAW
ncbi:alpha/beta hydrolase [Aquabacterium sp.]|uniref:alpha/beta hydrolase n=1 Tax=Aquabacterium sp. TaxID=1872578 RepID=UPI00248855AD|nr:alpha/beta hydrolase [Aquabacterium sp.]MDI1260541.1 alpha/beta hydrolase [Aquabacterium sp.]